MNISLDIVLPSIIAGMLIMMIFSANTMIIKSTAENRVTHELQSKANTTIKIIQEQVRGLHSPEVKDDDSKLVFKKINGDSISISRNNRELVIESFSAGGGSSNTETYALKLSDLQFEAMANLLQVSVVTESIAEEEAGQQKSRYRAIANRSIHFSNIDYPNR